MAMITLDMHDAIAILRMKRGVTNAIDIDLVAELSNFLSRAAPDQHIHGLVLTGSNDKFFSIGFDLPTLYELPAREFAIFFKAFNRLCLDLYSWPKPTLAALPGHAIAGGCILALCCDHRLIAPGHKLIGLNEIKLGVPVPYPADRILREIVGGRRAAMIMEGGRFYAPDEANAIGLVDQVVSAEDLETTAIEKIGEIGAASLPAFALIKRNRVQPILDAVTGVLEAKERAFLECWRSPKARSRLAAALEKF